MRNIRNLLVFLVLSAGLCFAQAGGVVNGTRGFPQPNDGATGTVVNETAIVNPSGNAITASVGNTAVPTYIVVGGAGITGNAVLASTGTLAPCKMDATVASNAGGFYVLNSTTLAGDCHAQSTAPAAGVWVIGYLHDAATTAGSNALIAVASFSFGSGAGVTSITGDGALISNSGSTGPVTLALAQAPAHKYWGNNTGALATPGYLSILVADLPSGIPNGNLANSSITINTSAPLGGGGSVSLGSALTLNCSTCTTDFSSGVTAKVANFTLTATEDGKLVTFNGSSLTATLPAAPPSTTWQVTVLNLNATALTISRNALQINTGTNNISLPQFQAITIWTDGSNYFTDTVPSSPSSPITITATSGGLNFGCATCGVTTSGLNQFAATTSAQLAGVLSDEIGSGKAVFATALQGTDANVLTSGTVSGTGNTLCVDANGGATTTGCTSSGFSNPMTTLGDMIYENATPAAARLAGPTSGNSPYVLTSTPSAGVATTPAWAVTGVPVDSEAGASFTIQSDSQTTPDRAKLVATTNNTTSTAITVPQAGSTGIANNFPFVQCNTGTVVATDTPTTSTVNGNATLKLLGAVAGNNPECAFWWSDNTNWFAAEILPTDVNGRLQASGFPALTGDITGTAGSLSVVVSKINGGTVSGTVGDVTTYGASNVLADAGFLATNVVRKDTTNAAAAAMTLDLSAATGASAFKVPVQAGAVAGANGVIDYDSTNGNTHLPSGGADAIAGAVTGAVTDNDCAKLRNISSKIQIVDAGAACGSGGGGAAGASIFNSTSSATDTVTSATSLVGGGAQTIPANTLITSSPMVMNVGGVYTLPASYTGTLTFAVLVDGTQQATTGAVTPTSTAVTNAAWGTQCEIITRTTGTSGTAILSCPLFLFPSSTSAITLNGGSLSQTATFTINTTTSHTIDLQLTMSTATGSPSFTGQYASAFIGGAPVTSVATTGPLTGGTTGAVTIACPTCTTSAAALASNQAVNGAGSQGAATGFTGTAGTITSGHVAAYTASNVIGNQAALAQPIIGVFNSSSTWIASGEASVSLDATQNVTFGDNLCASPTSLGTAHDNGANACTTGLGIGIVKTTASSVSSATAFLALR